MRSRILASLCFLGLMTVGSGYGQQKISVNVPFAFSAGDKSLPSGQYDFVRSASDKVISVVNSQGNAVAAQVVTRIAKEIHTTPKDAHVVFDKVGENYLLSEIWIPEIDGFEMASTKEKHEHRILNVPAQ
jgi:hypothetical protein